MTENYNLNDAVKMIFGLGLSQLDNILPEIDENGFNTITRQKLLKAKAELENGGGTLFNNSQDMLEYAQNIAQ